MRNFLLSAIFFSVATIANAQACTPVCDSGATCYDKAAWVAEGEVYNLETHWSDKKQAYVADFDFAIESWVKGEMEYGHFLRFEAAGNCSGSEKLAANGEGWYRFYGAGNKNDFIYFEKLSD